MFRLLPALAICAVSLSACTVTLSGGGGDGGDGGDGGGGGGGSDGDVVETAFNVSASAIALLAFSEYEVFPSDVTASAEYKQAINDIANGYIQAASLGIELPSRLTKATVQGQVVFFDRAIAGDLRGSAVTLLAGATYKSEILAELDIENATIDGEIRGFQDAQGNSLSGRLTYSGSINDTVAGQLIEAFPTGTFNGEDVNFALVAGTVQYDEPADEVVATGGTQLFTDNFSLDGNFVLKPPFAGMP